MALTLTEPRRPADDEYAPYYGSYIGLVAEGPLLDTLATQLEETTALLRGVGATREHHRYAPGKWSVTDVVGHVADTERIFAYRALRFARGDATTLPGYDENAFADAAGYDARPLADVLEEFTAVRRATIALVRGLAGDVWGRRGVANGQPMTARATVWVIAGHERHHRNVLQERYGLG